MPSITERKLRFEFPDDWQVVAYDRPANLLTGEPASFYRRVMEKGGVQYVRGMDIVCRLPDASARLQFIEVKDDRSWQPTPADQSGCKKKEPRHTELFRTVMQKTAGTLSGLLLAERMQEASLLSIACLSQEPAIEVVLYLLEPEIAADPAENDIYRLASKQRVASLDQKLTNKLAEWGLLFHLYSATPERQPPDWQVREIQP